MSKKITFTIPDDPNVGDMSKAIIKMMKKHIPADLIGTVTYFIDAEFTPDEEEEEEEEEGEYLNLRRIN